MSYLNMRLKNMANTSHHIRTVVSAVSLGFSRSDLRATAIASTCRLQASFGPLLNQPPFESSEFREDIEYQFSGSTGGIDGSPKLTLFVTILSFMNNASH